MKFHKDLTLVLLVHNNTKFPRRWIEYSSFISLPYKILIADGGNTDEFDKYISQNKSKLNLDLEYFRYYNEKGMSDYYNKSLDILNKVKTPYTAICSDDDFFLPSGIEKSLSFLNKNKEFSSARGEILGIEFKNFSNKDCTYGDNYEISYSSSVLSNLEHNIIEERLFLHLSNYQLTFFDIHRSQDLLFAYKKLVKLNPKNYILHEIITSGFTVLKGKVFRGDFPYLIKDMGPSGTTKNEKKFLTYLDWLTKSSWGTEYKLMINSFKKYIEENQEVPGKKFDLHSSHLKNLRVILIQNLYANDALIIKIFIYIATRIELLSNPKNLFLKIIRIYKKIFCKIIVKSKKIIKNNDISKLNYDLIKLINFLNSKD